MSWAMRETQTANLGDQRLNKRMTKLLDSALSQPTASIPVACRGWQETLAAYRFFANPKVKAENVLAPHRTATRERMAKQSIVLCVQDTTELDYSGQSQTQGLGPLTYTVKKGKTYRYYAPGRDRNFGAGSSGFGNLPAEPIEHLVVTQVCDSLRSPQQVQAVWAQVHRIAPEITEPEVVLPMRRLAGLWSTLFPAEQRRLVQLLIERVLISAEGLEIIWRDAGWHALAEELQPGTIAAELAAEEGMA